MNFALKIESLVNTRCCGLKIFFKSDTYETMEQRVGTRPAEIRHTYEQISRNTVKTGSYSYLSAQVLHRLFLNDLFRDALDKTIAPGIKWHSIIAFKGDEDPPDGDDGVVKYTSEHIDYAASEFIVRDEHSCQSNPLVIEEVRRILIENLNQSGSIH